MDKNLPEKVELNGEIFKIRKKCDFRIVLDCLKALNDERLEDKEKLACALTIFYEDFEKILAFPSEKLEILSEKMLLIICEDQFSKKRKNQKIIDFEKDFPLIVSALLPVLGYDIRERRHLHWWTFLSAFREIRNGAYATILTIRSKKAKGKPLEKEEKNFFYENREKIELIDLTEEEKEFLLD